MGRSEPRLNFPYTGASRTPASTMAFSCQRSDRSSTVPSGGVWQQVLADAVGERGVAGHGPGDRRVETEPVVEVPAGAHVQRRGVGQRVEDAEAHRRGEREPAPHRVQPGLHRRLGAGMGADGGQDGRQPGEGEHSKGGHVARQAGPCPARLPTGGQPGSSAGTPDGRHWTGEQCSRPDVHAGGAAPGATSCRRAGRGGRPSPTDARRRCRRCGPGTAPFTSRRFFSASTSTTVRFWVVTCSTP